MRPGAGFIEHIEIDWAPRVQHRNGSPAPPTELMEWWEKMQRASASRPIAYREDTGDLLERAGFVDIMHQKVRISLQPSIDRRDFDLARHFQSFMCLRDDEDGGVPQSFENLTLSLFYRQLQLPVDQILRTCNTLRGIYASRRYPLYHVMYAQRNIYYKVLATDTHADTSGPQESQWASI